MWQNHFHKIHGGELLASECDVVELNMRESLVNNSHAVLGVYFACT